MKAKSLRYHRLTCLGDGIGIRSIPPGAVPHELLCLGLGYRRAQQATSAEPSRHPQRSFSHRPNLLIDCLPKGTIKALRLQRHRASSTASEFTAKVGVVDGLTIVLSRAGKGCGGRTYTLRGQNVV